jgi:hypothetical protein
MLIKVLKKIPFDLLVWEVVKGDGARSKRY